MSRAGAGLQRFHKLMTGIGSKHEAAEAFEGLLDFIIAGHCIDGTITFDRGGAFSKEEAKTFYDLYAEVVGVMDKRLDGETKWFDPFGAYYEEFVASASKKSGSGQFFTPVPVCDAMAVMALGEVGAPGIPRVNDPACGSGRTLLAFHAGYGARSYLVAEDIDRFSCKMCVCNFMLNGCVGEVLWHNSLDPRQFHYGWRVNRFLYDPLWAPAVPHVETLTDGREGGAGGGRGVGGRV